MNAPYMVVVIVTFMLYYGAGLSGAQRKRHTVKAYRLPKVIKYILFLGMFDGYTLNIIIYQTSVVFVTITTVVFAFLGYPQVLMIYFCFIFVFLIEALYIIALDRVDRKKGQATQTEKDEKQESNPPRE